MKTEFNLSEKRKELNEDCQGFSVSSIMDLVEQQDKEFIKRLKEKQYVWVTDNAETGEGHYQISPVGIFIKVEDIDKLAGLEITK